MIVPMRGYFFWILSIVSGTFSCTSSKHVLTEADILQVKDSYIQKVMPGLEGMTPHDILILNFQAYPTERYFIDSLYFANKVYYMNQYQLNYNINISTGIDALNAKYTNPSDSVATIFYHDKTNNYYKTLQGIHRKNPLYMP